MTLQELDAALAQMPEARAIMLTYGDWPIIETPEALLYRQPRVDGLGYQYRGVPVWIVSPGPSRVSLSLWR